MLGTQEGTTAVHAGFPEEAALESNLKEAQPMEQRERVPVSIPTFPGGRGSVFLSSYSRRLANKPGREAMLLTSCSANCQLFTLEFPSLVLSQVSPTQKGLQGGDGDYGPPPGGRKSESIEEGLPAPHPHI